ncbi:MAG: 50S ribosomal protein L35 [bacterium]|nr:50S ribosomal protein L35 [bacterium]
MPKMKTNRGAAKRFKKTGGSVIRRGKAFRRHILTKKTTKTKRDLRQPGIVHASDVKEVLKLLPY